MSKTDLAAATTAIAWKDSPMNRIHLRHALRASAFVAIAGASLTAAQAAEPTNAKARPNAEAAAERSLQEFTQRFRAQNPGTRVDAVSLSPITGLYEVVMGKNVAYTDSVGRYVLFGHVWDMEARRDLTADRKAQLDRIDVASMPVGLAIKHVRGKGTRTLYVFADPQCGYCKQLEQALQGLDDTTVYTFVLPVLGAESKRLAANVACSADPAKSWADWMLRSQAPTAAAPACPHDAEGVEKLARSLGIDATPTLVSADGRKNVGAMSTSQLGAWLAAGAQTAGASIAAAPGR